MREEGVDVTLATGAREVCESADIVIVATPSREAIVRADWLRAGMHVNAIGADSPGKQELEPECLAQADVLVVDRLSQCVAFGELKHAVDASLVAASKAVELGQIVAGHRNGRTSDTQITIADLTGVGFQDTAIASEAFMQLSTL